MSIRKEVFGTLADGREVYAYTLRNVRGAEVTILTLGGAVQRILVPDRNGVMGDVICGFDRLEDYLACPGQHGALIGRFANRIARGRFTLDGREYVLATNNGVNHLHGGNVGYHHRLFAATEMGEDALSLHYVSPDGEEGYPGTLDVTVVYRFSDEDALSIEYTATTDQKTVVNLTNHAYFNLGGMGAGNVLSHTLTLDADTYLPVDDTKIPTGEKRSVVGTPFDFLSEKEIGADMPEGGYDHCFNFTGGATDAPVLRGTLYDPVSGREMRMFTDQISVQLYTGNHLGDPAFPFKGNTPQQPFGGVCLETQRMPDSPNQRALCCAELAPNECYRHVTVYAFSTRS